jgi:flavin reductase (DIM6/NTAB) family NADH-FMN oxidoreductase RutF
VTPGDLRQVFRQYPAGVAVVTADDGGSPVGLTVTSLASVSTDPPTISFNVAHASSVWPALARADRVVVHLLRCDQAGLGATFARRGADRFAAPTRWRASPDGIPFLLGCLAWMTGAVTNRFAVGDHSILVAAVAACGTDGGEPLLYHDRAFHALGAALPGSTAHAQAPRAVPAHGMPGNGLTAGAVAHSRQAPAERDRVGTGEARWVS